MGFEAMIPLGVGLRLDIKPVATLRARKGDDSGQRPGTFTSQGVQDQLTANKQAGAVLRQQVALRIKNHVDFGRRKAASTGTLYRVSASERNQLVTKEFVGVGIPSYLDGSAAKYWRTFEEGSAFWGFAGTPLFFKGRPGFPVAHGANPGLRTGKGDFAERHGLDGDDDGDNGSGTPSTRKTFYVSHEIAPTHIYESVYNDFRPEMVAFGYQGAVRYLDRVLGHDIVIAGKGFTPPSV